MTEDSSTDALRAAQEERERAEREQAQVTDAPEEAQAHERRADKAAYLRERLEARAESERGAPPTLAPDPSADS
jgi:hypothetical protein